MSKKERVDAGGDQPKRYKNVFVKNFGDAIDSTELQEMFSKFGPISSVIVMMDQENKSRGFGFVAFQDHDAAEKVCFIHQIFIFSTLWHNLIFPIELFILNPYW